MRVLMLSKACIVGHYQTKLDLLAQKPDVKLTVVVPPSWRDERGVITLEQPQTNAYRFIVAPMMLNGHYHLNYYPTIGDIIRAVQPDIVHLDEEPYNLATSHAMFKIRQVCPDARILFFTWQNLLRYYPAPFMWMEQYVYAHSKLALAGNENARDVLLAKGFTDPIRVVPQFGVDETRFRPVGKRGGGKGAVIGFAGRLVQEKGVSLLLRSLNRVKGDWELRILGSGPLEISLMGLAKSLGFADRVSFSPWRPSAEMPQFYNGLDVLVVPSISRPNWQEQFGRVLFEAMACEVPVIGSSSGEIPNAVGDAGIIFAERNVVALGEALQRVIDDPRLRERLGSLGRERVLNKYTQSIVAEETFRAYRELQRSGNGSV